MAKTPSLKASTRLGLSVMPQTCFFCVDSAQTQQAGIHALRNAYPSPRAHRGRRRRVRQLERPRCPLCLPRPSAPDDGAPTIVITGQVTDIVTHNAVSSAPVFAFRSGDTTTLAADTTNTPGFYSLTISTGATPVDGYVRVTESGHITTYAYPAQPITRDTLDNISMVTPAEFSLLAAAAGITPQPGKGFIGVLVKDCTGAAITGAAVSTTPAATVLYNVAGVPSSSATATAGDGIAYIANVAAGNVTVQASASGHTLRQHVVNARADVITLTEIRP